MPKRLNRISFLSADKVPLFSSIIQKILCPELSTALRRERLYLQFLFCIRVTHTTFLDHSPEGCVIEVVDVAYNEGMDKQT